MTTPPPFEIRSSFTPQALLVSVTGEVDMTTAPRLGDAVETVSDRVELVVVDLSDVSFIDSSALNRLVHAQRNLGEREIKIALVVPSAGLVRRVFDIANLTEQLNVVETPEEALR